MFPFFFFLAKRVARVVAVVSDKLNEDRIDDEGKVLTGDNQELCRNLPWVFLEN